MSETTQPPDPRTAVVEGIPLLWIEPTAKPDRRRLALCLPGLTGTKEHMLPYVRSLADAGFIALAFDPWQHGERAAEESSALGARVFGQFRRFMWPILGQTTLDTLRVIDWAVATLGVEPSVVMSGTSMGGDISVAAAGLDARIDRVAALVATPDWTRPGMQDLFQPGTLLPQGEADAYARFFYDQLNPLTHLSRYARGPAIRFICGAEDTHVPPDGALRFQAALRAAYPAAAERVVVDLLPGRGHMDFRDPDSWWPAALDWLTRAE